MFLGSYALASKFEFTRASVTSFKVCHICAQRMFIYLSGEANFTVVSEVLYNN